MEGWKNVNCDFKKGGSLEERGKCRGGMKSRKAIPGGDNSTCKTPEAERSGRQALEAWWG